MRNNSAPAKWSKLWIDTPGLSAHIGAYSTEQLERVNQESRRPWSTHFGWGTKARSRRKQPARGFFFTDC
jgi:hypothetical protein